MGRQFAETFCRHADKHWGARFGNHATEVATLKEKYGGIMASINYLQSSHSSIVDIVMQLQGAQAQHTVNAVHPLSPPPLGQCNVSGRAVGDADAIVDTVAFGP